MFDYHLLYETVYAQDESNRRMLEAIQGCTLCCNRNEARWLELSRILSPGESSSSIFFAKFWGRPLPLRNCDVKQNLDEKRNVPVIVLEGLKWVTPRRKRHCCVGRWDMSSILKKQLEDNKKELDRAKQEHHEEEAIQIDGKCKEALGRLRKQLDDNKNELDPVKNLPAKDNKNDQNELNRAKQQHMDGIS